MLRRLLMLACIKFLSTLLNDTISVTNLNVVSKLDAEIFHILLTYRSITAHALIVNYKRYTGSKRSD